MMLGELNYLAIAVSTLVAFIVGWIWYGPLFGKAWMKMVGMSEADMKGSMAGAIVGGLITTFLMALTMAWLVTALGVSDWQTALRIALIVGIGLVAMFAFNDVIYEKKPFGLYLIKTGYALASLIAMAVIYTVWVN